MCLFLRANPHHAPTYRPQEHRSWQKHCYTQNSEQPGLQHLKHSTKHEPLETIYSIYEPTLNTQNPQKSARQVVSLGFVSGLSSIDVQIKDFCIF
jgi:hypothetical protein